MGKQVMKNWLGRAGMACVLAGAGAFGASAQDVVITNARILDGAGGVIENGSLVVDDGVITSVGAGSATLAGATVIDAEGRTVLPGFIDAHRHLGGGAPDFLDARAPAAMQGWLDAGFTTMLDALAIGPSADQYVELRRRIDAGEMAGPRLKLSGMVPLNQTALPQGMDAARADPARTPLAERPPVATTPPEQARAMVAGYAAQGLDNIKVIVVASPAGTDLATLQAIADEAHMHGLRMITHTTSVDDALVAAEAGTDYYAHTPHIGWVDEGDAIARIVATGAPMVSTLGVFTPYYGVEGDGLFRDFGGFPYDGTLHSAGQGAVNLRLLAEAGVIPCYGTDTSFSPRESLRHELRALGAVFSPADIVKMMTGNAAVCAAVDDVTGTLAVGKAGDIVMVEGDPLEDIDAVLDVALVLKGGAVVVDNR
jgi:imidazolonepropionase-like amidohydrolase